ncbi:DExH-box ATP-dependent RNA helicase DExH15 chloroplastic-like protein, partial [Drosera capensis]
YFLLDTLLNGTVTSNYVIQSSNVIYEARALDIKTNIIFPLGETASKIRGRNELWLSMVLRNKLLIGLGPAQLAAVCGSLVSEGMKIRPSKDNSFNMLLPTHLPCCLDIQFLGVVEAWASGLTWQEITMDSAVDEGDLDRLLRRTIDLLAQFPKLPDIDPALQDNALKASSVMEGSPISELAGCDEAILLAAYSQEVKVIENKGDTATKVHTFPCRLSNKGLVAEIEDHA